MTYFYYSYCTGEKFSNSKGHVYSGKDLTEEILHHSSFNIRFYDICNNYPERFDLLDINNQLVVLEVNMSLKSKSLET